MSFLQGSPEKEIVRLRLPQGQVDLTNWTHYSFNSNFLTPTDAFSFTIGAERIDDKTKAALTVGARAALYINGNVQADGYIDAITIAASSDSGTEFTIEGRDRLSRAVDSCADPRKTYKAAQTILQVLQDIFGPFGWLSEDSFALDNADNVGIMAGHTRGEKSSKSKKHFGEIIKSVKIHQLRPHNGEGAFAFASRLTQRHGLWIWCSADGEQLVISKPDFDQDPLYKLRRRRGFETNVLSGSVKFDGSSQPSVVIADGFSGGGEFGKSRMVAYAVNPYFGVDNDGFVLPEVLAAVKPYPDAQQITLTTQPFPRRTPEETARPLFMHDDESHTPEQLANFVRREMSTLMHRSLVAHYTVVGHTQDGAVWSVDTVVDVDDEVAGLKERMYVLGRTFAKSRQGGTTTSLELVRLNSIQF